MTNMFYTVFSRKMIANYCIFWRFLVKIIQIIYLDFCVIALSYSGTQTAWPNFIQFLNASTSVEVN